MQTTNVTSDVIINDVDICLAALAAVMGVAAITLNFMVIYVISRTKSLHTSTNAFIFSLCIAELLVSIFAVSFAGGSRILREWWFSLNFCTLSGFLYNLGRNGATYSLMMVCLDRCVAVCKPIKYSNIMTIRTCAIMTAFAWSQSLVLALIPFFGKGMYTFIVKYSLCMLLGDAESIHMLLKELFGCLLPAAVIIVTFLKIVKQSYSHNRVFAPMFFPVAMPVTTPHYGRNNTLKAMKALFIIILSYTLLCIPLSIVKIVDQTSTMAVPEVVVTSLVWLSFLCCVINPIVIATMNRKFKQSFLKLFCNCVKRRHKDAKEVDGFTITSGLHAVLEASFAISVVHHGDKEVKRHVMLSKERTKFDLRTSRTSVVLRARTPPMAGTPPRARTPPLARTFLD